MSYSRTIPRRARDGGPRIDQGLKGRPDDSEGQRPGVLCRSRTPRGLKGREVRRRRVGLSGLGRMKMCGFSAQGFALRYNLLAPSGLVLRYRSGRIGRSSHGRRAVVNSTRAKRRNRRASMHARPRRTLGNLGMTSDGFQSAGRPAHSIRAPAFDSPRPSPSPALCRKAAIVRRRT
jgi:hypothetical protein